MEIRSLKEADDRSGFRCGDPDLDRFLQRFSGQNQFRHHIGTTYVAVDGGRILGYATVAPGQIEIEDMPLALRRRFPRYPLPVLRLARLATDESARGKGIGKALLRFVFTLALKLATDYGCVGVVVDAKLDAVPFYEGFGFTALEVLEGELSARPTPIAMFLSIAEMRAALRS